MINEESLTSVAVVIGAGTMGAGIAAQLANAGWDVWLLDLPSSPHRNQRSQDACQRLLSARPPLLVLPEYIQRIHVGNIEDDADCLKEAHWIVEAVIEQMEAKREVLALTEEKAAPNAIVTSNTSGLSLQEMSRGRTSRFLSRFFGTHFLNPPRYLKLLEVIPLPTTLPEQVTAFTRFAEQVLGHRVVYARDTPGFISTRLWIEHLMETLHRAEEYELTVEEVDALTGPLLGRPRSATYRMADIVGLDIVAAVAEHQYALLPNDPRRAYLELPPILKTLLQRGYLGEKSKGGFTRRQNGTLEVFDSKLQGYRLRKEVHLPFLEQLQPLPLKERFREIARAANSPLREARFLHTLLTSFLDYVEQIGPEIAQDILSIDRAMRWGFQWEMGPGEIADSMFPAKTPLFYTQTEHQRFFRHFAPLSWRPFPIEPEYLSLDELKAEKGVVLGNATASLIDLGDQVFCFEYHTKMNTFEPDLVTCLESACDYIEKVGGALVLGNQANLFSAGYNLRLFLNAIEARNWHAIDKLLHAVQFAFLRLKYAPFPVVAAPHGYTLGAGCEANLHSAHVQAARDLAMGLPEVRVGLIPAGGGTKELLARTLASPAISLQELHERFIRLLELLVIPPISTSAHEAKKIGLLRPSDGITANGDRLLYEAKQKAIHMLHNHHTPPPKPIFVPLNHDMARQLETALGEWVEQQRITQHDATIGRLLIQVLCGSSQARTEEEVLQQEREALIEAARYPLSVESIRYVLATEKHLRN